MLDEYRRREQAEQGGRENAFTAQDYTMRVWLRPDRLASLGITPQDVSDAIKEQNAQSPSGRIGAEPAPPLSAAQWTRDRRMG